MVGCNNIIHDATHVPELLFSEVNARLLPLVATVVVVPVVDEDN